jgi:hypothetical protein
MRDEIVKGLEESETKLHEVESEHRSIEQQLQEQIANKQGIINEKTKRI